MSDNISNSKPFSPTATPDHFFNSTKKDKLEAALDKAKRELDKQSSRKFSKRHRIWNSLKEKASELGSSISRKFSNFFASVAERFTKSKAQSEIVQSNLKNFTDADKHVQIKNNNTYILDTPRYSIERRAHKYRSSSMDESNYPQNRQPSISISNSLDRGLDIVDYQNLHNNSNEENRQKKYEKYSGVSDDDNFFDSTY
jgi:hypothetical protein